VKDGETRIVFAMEGVPGFNDIFTDAEGPVHAGSQRFGVAAPDQGPARRFHELTPPP
jgi:hypothetical protein